MREVFKKKWQSINKYGFIIIWWKLCELCLNISAVFCIPFVIIIRLLRKWIIIRFGHLRSERIGHFVGNIELYLSRRDLNKDNKKYYDIFYYSNRICNYQWKKMVERLVRVSWFAKIMDKSNRLLQRGSVHIIPDLKDKDDEDAVCRAPRHFYFTKQENLRAQKGLERFGVPPEAPFVCIFARDSAYLKQTFGKAYHDWSYHNYRDADIDNYLLAAQELVKRGYYVIRIGSIMHKALGIKHPKIIDYSFSHLKNDLLDIYLIAKNQFLLGVNSGIYNISRVFRKPMACVNLVPLDAGTTYYLYPGSVFIPKKIWCRKSKRFLTIKEIVQREIWRFCRGPEYEEAQIDVIENSPQEIFDLAVEMEERLKKVWVETEEDKALQEKFCSIVPWRKYLHGGFIRIGTKFLRKNKHLLE